eukprot:COSAG02_NODE_1637_length_11547_cov_10.509085_2_plen_85_part_00
MLQLSAMLPLLRRIGGGSSAPEGQRWVGSRAWEGGAGVAAKLNERRNRKGMGNEERLGDVDEAKGDHVESRRKRLDTKGRRNEG